MMRIFVAIAFALLLAPSTSAAQRPAEDAVRPRDSDVRTLRVGYTAFEHPQSVTADSGLHSIARYLQHVSSRSKAAPWRKPVAFEVSVGNYYQVWSWLDRGELDAAIVSPFIAHLLEQNGKSLAVLEFSEHCQTSGHQPLIAASLSDKPLEVYREYLARLYAVAARDLSPDDARAAMVPILAYARLNFVAHLSSSGFIIPVLYAEDWLRHQSGGAVNSSVADRFWKLYFTHARFALHHGVEPPTNRIRDLYFSYSGRSTSRLSSDAAEGGFAAWQRYSVDSTVPADRVGPACRRDRPEAPEIPNDVLVVRRSVLHELFGSQWVDRELLGNQLLSDPARVRDNEALFASDAGYLGVHWFASSVHETFRRRVKDVFSRQAVNDELIATYVSWFENRQFEFTVDETLGLLRLDQMNSRTSRLSVVLSGGGVKSLYQTKLLDRLYGTDGSRPWLRNFDPAAPVTGPTADGPLVVDNIIGTSGGAMLALFAAQLPAQARHLDGRPSPDNGLLTRLLDETSGRRLFPRADIPRVVSIVLLLLILFLVLSVARVASKRLAENAHHAVQKDCPWPVIGIELLLILAGAMVVVMTRRQDVETAHGVEGAAYALLVATAHLSVSCIGYKRNGAPRSTVDGTLRRLSVIGGLFGVMVVAGAFATFHLSEAVEVAQPTTAWVPPLMAISGVCVIAIAILTAAAARVGGLYLHRERFHDYGCAIAVAGIVVGASYLIVVAGAVSGWTSTLELTGPFWYWLVPAGAVSSTAVVLIATLGGRHKLPMFLLRGVGELMRDRKGAATTTLSGSLTAIAGIALTCWTAIVAPAIYGNDPAREALEYAQTALSGSPDRGMFRSSLIVTGALLRPHDCHGESVRPGGMYFCFGGPGGCGTAQGVWQAFEMPVPRRALDAVFASGSPFPVFSPHRTHLANGCAVPLVDGGYAHNVPLQAAMLADARQVLTINASPSEADLDDMSEASAASDRWPLLRGSQLVQFGSRIAGFMFSRAQDLDRNAAVHMMVASLAPQPDGGRWASLLDFTKSTRNWMIAAARTDLAHHRRVGRVESWGSPAVITRLDPDDPAVAPRGWTKDAAATKDGVIRNASAKTVVVMDMDNTILRGDFGEALFLKMIVDREYAGDNPQFWRLFPNQRAAQALREYWTDLKDGKATPGAYLTPEQWTPEFADYVVLFFRQYEELYNAPGGDGARQAYAWVVRLMAGLPLDRVERVIGDLWKSEMERPTTPVRIRSAAYGEMEIAGGVRVHQELKDLVDALQAKQAQVWIVTASSERLGQHVAGLLKIPRQRVLGMRLDPANPFGPLAAPETYREGKAEAVRLHGLRPGLAIGDSPTDIEMLNAAPAAILVDRGRIPDSEIRPHWKRQPFELLRTTTIK